ncbi:MAG: DUF222 domain-containing protein [Pseudonocardiaceae bacterium]
MSASPARCVRNPCPNPAWLEQIPEPGHTGQIPASECTPSGWLALELDHGTVEPALLSDTDLIDTIVGFDRVSSWASARQATLLAEFARRRPEDHPLAARSDVPSSCSEFAPDEVSLALRLSRSTATARLVMAQTMAEQLPRTLAAWEAGAIDVLKARVQLPAAPRASRRAGGPGTAPRRDPDTGPVARLSDPGGAGARPAGCGGAA